MPAEAVRVDGETACHGLCELWCGEAFKLHPSHTHTHTPTTRHGIWCPARQRLQEPRLRRVHARLAQDIKMDPARPEYHRAVARWEDGAERGVSGQLVAHSTGGQISSRLLSLRSANVLLEIPRVSCGVRGVLIQLT